MRGGKVSGEATGLLEVDDHHRYLALSRPVVARACERASWRVGTSRHSSCVIIDSRAEVSAQIARIAVGLLCPAMKHPCHR